MINRYIPIDQYAALLEIDEVKIKKCMYVPTSFNYLRFKIKDNKLYVCDNFNAPLKNELFELKLKALIISKKERALCKELYLLSDKKLKVSTLEKYFYRSSFKSIKKAISIIKLLKKYIAKNSLFSESELSYE
jgi:hypothetical protein